MLDFIIEIALKSGKIIRKGYQNELENIQHKGDIDLVTEIDLESESFLKKEIYKRFPDHSILAEESDLTNNESNYKWIIDPLDGTTNFAHKFPFCAVSIALEIGGIITYGVVYNPILDELFHARKNHGAFRNDKPIKVSKTAELSQALIATGFPYDRWEKGDYYIKEYLALMKKSQGVRRCGAAAIDLCYLACGRLDGFFEHKLKPWDTAAASLIIREADGKITDYQGKPWNCYQTNIIASNGLIHNHIKNELSKAHL